MTLFAKIIIILILLVLAAAFALLCLLCYLFTKTTNVKQFYLDPTYFCFATLNYEYAMNGKKCESMEEFIEMFDSSYLNGGSIFHYVLITESRKRLLLCLLSNPEFIKENFGEFPYTTSVNERIVTKWNAQFANNNKNE